MSTSTNPQEKSAPVIDPVQLLNNPGGRAVNEEIQDAIVHAKKLRWKIDLHVMPLIVITYMLQSLDKTTLGTAAVFGIRVDANLQGNDFSWLGSLFYLGFLVWEFPTNLLLQRFPVGKVLSITVFLWGIVLMCHAACHSFSGLAACRTFLGALESSCNPATMIIFGMWYTRAEQPLRFGIWIGSAGIAYVLGGLISYGIGHIQGPLSSWQTLFLLYGAITTGWGVALWFFLPDSPLSAKFLSPSEKEGAVLRIANNSTGIENKSFKKEQFIECMLDIKSWLFVAFGLFVNAPNGVFVNFQGIIIRSLDFTILQTTLIQMPSGDVQFVACTSACYFASRFPNLRNTMIIVFVMPFLVGLLGLHILPQANHYGRLVSLWLCFFYTAPWPLIMALVNANTAGHTKRITTNSLLIIAAGLGSFIGPFFYRAEQEPEYPLGFDMMFVCFGGIVAAALGMITVCWVRNRKRKRTRDNAENDVWLAGQNGFLDLTDMKNMEFKYVY